MKANNQGEDSTLAVLAAVGVILALEFPDADRFLYVGLVLFALGLALLLRALLFACGQMPRMQRPIR